MRPSASTIIFVAVTVALSLGFMAGQWRDFAGMC
jgi:hypothetical protein